MAYVDGRVDYCLGISGSIKALCAGSVWHASDKSSTVQLALKAQLPGVHTCSTDKTIFWCKTLMEVPTYSNCCGFCLATHLICPVLFNVQIASCSCTFLTECQPSVKQYRLNVAQACPFKDGVLPACWPGGDARARQKMQAQEDAQNQSWGH